MYKNRTSRTNAVPTIDRQPQFFINRSEIAFDERARFVEFVCSVWNEGRFGPDLAPPVTIDRNDRPETEPTAFYDLPDDRQNGVARYYALSPLGRAVYQVLDAELRRAKQTRLLAASANGSNTTANSSSNQGRGSPCILKHQRCVVLQPAAAPQEGEINDLSRNAAA